MRRLKKFISAFLAVTALCMSCAMYPISVSADEISGEAEAYYYFFEGTVKEIVSYYNQEGEIVDGTMYILVEDEDGNIVNFFVNEETYMIAESELSIGATVKGFYNAKLPVIMIYPPQYRAVALAVNLTEVQNITVDRFDEDFLSSDQNLKLNISEETEIIYQDGTTFDGEISEIGGRDLIVMYTIATASLPAQTPPVKVVILNEESENIVKLNGDIIVNGTKIDAPKPYIGENGAVMVPLRAVSEALGYEVNWEAETQSVLIGMGISITIGKDYYIYMRTSPIELGTAPELTDGVTYVPMEFFSVVMRINDVGITDEQIIINTLTDTDSSGNDTITIDG